MSTSKVSFTIRRPTPVSLSESDSEYSAAPSPASAVPRHLISSHPGSPLARSATSSPQPTNNSDSSDEDDAVQDELVTGFDQFGVQRVNGFKSHKSTAPLVIAPLQNRDWREMARKRRSAGQYVPPSGAAQNGADGSVGGLGVRDTINSGPVLSGLQIRKEEIVQTEQMVLQTAETPALPPQEDPIPIENESQLAIRAILAEAEGTTLDGPLIDIIPSTVSEADALRQDMEDLPESATLDDYARVPVSQFGAALLRGMGWKEGSAASRKPGKGLVQPYIPQARPAFLGIGAKEQEVYDDGRPSKSSKRTDRRYVPVVRKDRDGNEVPEEKERRKERSRSPTNGASRSSRSYKRSSTPPDRYRSSDDHQRSSSKRERDRDHGRDRDYRRDRDHVRDRSKDRDSRRRDY